MTEASVQSQMNATELITLDPTGLGFDHRYEKGNEFFTSGAKDPKTGGRDYDYFVVAWAEPPRGWQGNVSAEAS
jgi:hypothetical protein